MVATESAFLICRTVCDSVSSVDGKFFLMLTYDLGTFLKHSRNKIIGDLKPPAPLRPTGMTWHAMHDKLSKLFPQLKA